MTDALTIPVPYVLRPQTIEAARRVVAARAEREQWTPDVLADILAALGLLEASAARLPAEPEAPAPVPCPPAPPAADDDTVDDDDWLLLTIDVLDETGIGRSKADSWIRSGHISHAAVRQPSGAIVPIETAIPRSGNVRVWTRGGIAHACRVAHLDAAWRHRPGGLTLADCSAIAGMGHAHDLDPSFAARIDWAAIATAARAAVDTRPPGCDIWRDALRELAHRADSVAADLARDAS